MRYFMIMVLLAALTGCATAHVQVQRPKEKKVLPDGREVVAELKGDNTCYYLFGFIPLWCGNSNRPNTGDYDIFRDRLSEIRNDATLYLFSVSDNALPSIIADMPSNDALWVHTAGSMEAGIFSDKTPHYGVLYPMQTVHKERETDWCGVPIFIEASDEPDCMRIEALATRISGHVIRCDSAQRKAVHLAAVFACNFSNHMYAIEAQTGPAIRHDKNVMSKHLALLEGTPEAELYKLISLDIERYGQNKNSCKNNSNNPL